MKMADDFIKDLKPFQTALGRYERNVPIDINPDDLKTLMLDYAKQACEQLRAKCAEEAKLSSQSCGDSMTCGCQGNCDHPVFSVNRKSILSVDIDQFLK